MDQIKIFQKQIEHEDVKIEQALSAKKAISEQQADEDKKIAKAFDSILNAMNALQKARERKELLIEQEAKSDEEIKLHYKARRLIEEKKVKQEQLAESAKNNQKSIREKLA